MNEGRFKSQDVFQNNRIIEERNVNVVVEVIQFHSEQEGYSWAWHTSEADLIDISIALELIE